jgi:predicted Zn-dependent protease
MPGNSGLLLNLALAQHMAGHEREAAANFEIVLKSEPKSLPALLSLGAARMTLNEPQLALPPLRKAVLYYPTDREARGMLADALLEMGNLTEAAEQYRKLADASPDDPRAWYGLGKAYEAMAGSAFERLQKINPQSAWVSALIADSRVQVQQYRSAFFFYKEALKQLPNLHGLHAAMAELYRKTGHPDWAAAEDVKERALPSPDCKLHAAECAFIGGHDLQATMLPATPAPSAEALYWQAKAANELALQTFFRLGQLPPSVELHRLRAEIARNSRQPGEAVKEWRAALQLAPNDPQLRQELALSLFMAQDYKGALEQATALLKLAPKSPELNFLAGDSLLRLEQPEKAIPYLRAALAGDPGMLPADASLGLALFRVGKTAEAVAHLEKSEQLDEDGSLHYQLSRAYQSSGQAEKARTAMAKYQEIVKRNEQAKAELERETQIAPPQ